MTALPSGASSRLLDSGELTRTVRRLAHEVRERHPGLAGVVLAAVCDGGVPLGRRLRAELAELGEPEPPLLALDVGDYRDDRPRPARPVAGALSRVPPAGRDGVPTSVRVEAAIVVLVDDVIHTGRTLRAALDLLADHGRPAAVEPLVLVDRGHRELPLRATYVGRNLPVAAGAWVEVLWDPSGAGVWLVEPQPASLRGGGPVA
ncbi:MAG: pyrimidine operon attenuation protein / uracil phosphoribosyltransferase [Chloroflexota bacterium]|nr:pyrimidine operon attenuation protein / uracil phosphoribosyltransferase [Chloroflexota bacterium]